MKGLLLKVLLSLGLVTYLVSWVSVSDLFGVLSSARLSYVFVVLVLYFLGQVISSFRWALLSRPLGFCNPLKDFTVFYFIGMFFNLFAPSTVGGDAGRVIYLSRGGAMSQSQTWLTKTGTALTSVVVDRVVGMAALVWIGAAALAFFPVYSLPTPVRWVTFALALGLFLGWLFLPWIRRRIGPSDHPQKKGFVLAMVSYGPGQRVIFQTLALSLLVHLGQAVSHVLLGWSLELEIPWSYSLILYPLVGVFSAIPVSFNGIGLREGGYLFMLRQIEIAPEKAIAFGILWFAVIVLESLMGGVVFVSRRGPVAGSSLAEGDQTR